MIDYILKPNTVGQNPSGYHAQTVQSEGSDLIKTMTSLRGGGTEGEAALWLDLVVRAIRFELSQGRRVKIKGLMNAKVDIRGSFPDAGAPFDPARNKLHITLTAGRDFTRALAGSPTSRVSGASSGLYIEHVLDAASNTYDSILSPGMALKIYGSLLKLVGADPSVGVSFLREPDEIIPVPAAAVTHNGDKEIDLIIPRLRAGAYLVQVTTMRTTNPNRPLKKPRQYIFPMALTVR